MPAAASTAGSSSSQVHEKGSVAAADESAARTSTGGSSSSQNHEKGGVAGADEPAARTTAPEDPDEPASDDDADEGRPVSKKLKGWARGVREDVVLKKHIEPYRRARQMGARDAEDYLQMVCNEYCYRIPYDLADGEEPTLPLREWTPTTPPDDDSTLTKKQRKAKEEWIVWMMPRIKRWLDYRSQGGIHATAATGKKLEPTDPINIMLFQIADTLPATRAHQGWQQFWHEESQTTIEAEVVRTWDASPARQVALAKLKQKEGRAKGKAKEVDVKPTGAFRQSVARALWKDMTKTEQQPYLERAAAEKAQESAAFDAAMKAWPPKDPAAIQAAIDNLEPTIGRFMQGVAELTNMHVLMTLGGPSPRFHGTLHTVHYSTGQNNAPSPVAFPDWDADHFNTHTLGKMKSYLRTAYSREECMASALPEHMCVGSREDAWASLPGSVASLDDPSLIVMPPSIENGDKAQKKKKTSSSKQSDDDDDDDIAREPASESDNDSRNESEGETGAKRKRKGGNAAGKGAKDDGKSGRAPRQKKPKTVSAPDPSVGIVTGKARPQPRPYRKAPALIALENARAAAKADNVVPLPRNDEEPPLRLQDDDAPPPPDNNDDSPAPPVDDDDAPAPPVDDDDASPPVDDDNRPPPEDVDMEKEPEEGEDGNEDVLETERTYPLDASDWVAEIWPEIAGKRVTASYDKLLEAFVAFERAHGWVDGEKALSASARPKQVKEWIRADRKATPRLIKLHKRYGEEFWIWWKFLQPQWRKAKTNWPSMDAVQDGDEGDWAALTVPGKNGLVSVVASLYWWGREGVEGGSVSPGWSSAVKDVTWALQRMALTGAS
ncbi:hypothetical protein C8F01DRAFT_1093506 [Mycena amicta]|nr:hypothetical protein C8F01DRAFT_1093506 [Mycena amicta]